MSSAGTSASADHATSRTQGAQWPFRREHKGVGTWGTFTLFTHPLRPCPLSYTAMASTVPPQSRRSCDKTPVVVILADTTGIVALDTRLRHHYINRLFRGLGEGVRPCYPCVIFGPHSDSRCASQLL
jgi:hypothetical protein